MTTTLPEPTEEDDNQTLLALLSRLHLRPENSDPPRTPSPPPYSVGPLPRPNTVPRTRSRAEPTPSPSVQRGAHPRPSPTVAQPPPNPVSHRQANQSLRETVYHYDSPGNTGYTNQWSVAGTATQGVAHASVHRIQLASPSKNKGSTVKAAYVIFCGTDTGVFFSWAQVKPLVTGVSNCIFRGYATLGEAYRAFEYAQAQSWVRVAGSTDAPIPSLPQPQGLQDDDEYNPLNGNESFDGNSLWYIVYRGITPGVYRSHLECQLNTLGVRGSLHESVRGREAAFAKFYSADDNHNVTGVPPTYRGPPNDPFL
ncbi:hypothetical protein C8R43DRAFT_1138111 [Mycena crocata]|nr:hypothetical protein C8R43DRAFT_1138111 [Mycena crocata]